MFKRIDHVAIHVADLDRSVEFYERHFGFKHYFRQTASGGLQIGYLKIGRYRARTDAPQRWRHGRFPLLPGDRQFQRSRRASLQRDGVKLLRAPHDTAAREPRENGWRRVVFAGPDGEQIELRG